MDNASFFLIFNLSRKWPLLDTFMIFITNYVIYLIFLLIFFLAVKGKVKERKALVLTILAIPIAILLIKFIHLFVNEPRPFVTFNFQPLTDNKPDPSFPSRHATIMAVIAFSYTYFKSKWALLFIILMILIGISRIYIGVHYPIDILGGFMVGIISLSLAHFFGKRLRLRFPLR